MRKAHLPHPHIEGVEARRPLRESRRGRSVWRAPYLHCTDIGLTSHVHYIGLTSYLHRTYTYLHYIGLISYLHRTRLLDRCKEAAQERSAVDPRERMARRPGEPPAAAGGIRQGLPRGEGGDVLGVTRSEEVGHVDGCEHEHLPLRVARRRRLRRGRGEVVMIWREIARDRARSRESGRACTNVGSSPTSWPAVPWAYTTSSSATITHSHPASMARRHARALLRRIPASPRESGRRARALISRISASEIASPIVASTISSIGGGYGHHACAACARGGGLYETRT